MENTEVLRTNNYTQLVSENDEPVISNTRIDGSGEEIISYPYKEVRGIGNAQIVLYQETEEELGESLLNRQGHIIFPNNEVLQTPVKYAIMRSVYSLSLGVENPLASFRQDLVAYLSVDGIKDTLKGLLHNRTAEVEFETEQSEEGARLNMFDWIEPESDDFDNNSLVFVRNDPASLSKLKFRFELQGGESN